MQVQRHAESWFDTIIKNFKKFIKNYLQEARAKASFFFYC